MKYLYAFDLSMKCSGLVIFDIDTFEPKVVTSFPTKDRWTHGKRMNQLYEGIKKYSKEYPVYEIAIERGFSVPGRNNDTQAVFRVHGLINWLYHKYEQTYYPPKSVKAAILTGNSSKEALAKKMMIHYPEVKFANNDESDAFAVGLCHLIKKYDMPWTKSSRSVEATGVVKKKVVKPKAKTTTVKAKSTPKPKPKSKANTVAKTSSASKRIVKT